MEGTPGSSPNPRGTLASISFPSVLPLLPNHCHSVASTLFPLSHRILGTDGLVGQPLSLLFLLHLYASYFISPLPSMENSPAVSLAPIPPPPQVYVPTLTVPDPERPPFLEGNT